jgi:hypothetical protein
LIQLLAALLLASTAGAQTLPARGQEGAGMSDSRIQSLELSVRQIQSGAPTLTSSPTIRGEINAVGGMEVDGQAVFDASSTFRGGVFGNVHNSSQAVRITPDWSTTPLVCLSTLAVRGSTITIHAQGELAVAGAAWTGHAGYLLNGACPQGWTCSGTCTDNINPYRMGNDAGGGIHQFSINARETAAYGAQNVCIWACANTDPGTTGTRLEFWLEGN